MKLKDFYIGQEVIYTRPRNPSFIGKVTKITSDRVTVTYGEDYFNKYGWCRYNYTPDFPNSAAQYMTPYDIRTTQQIVSDRCKKLWTNSNYVKNHPNLKYS